MTSSIPVPAFEPRVAVVLDFLRDLGDGGLRHAALDDWRWLAPRARGERSRNGDRATVPFLDLLVAADDLEALDVTARRRGLVVEEGAGGRGRTYQIEDGERWRLRACARLRYGGARAWLATGADENHLLRRTEEVDGVRLLAPSDRLVHLVLTCLLDVGAFPVPHRQELIELMERLRADPPRAGRAAERVQQELAPALDWSTLLADIVHGRWTDLLDRRRALRLRLWRREPIASTVRWLRGRRRDLAERPDGTRRGG